MFSRNSLLAAVAVVACAFTFNLASQAEVSVGSKSARPLITQKIDENNLVTLKGNTRSEARRPDFDRGAVSDSMQLDHMMLQLKRAPEQQKALDTLVDRLHKPGDPMFHQWMTVKEFGDTFGLAPGDLNAITGWLESHGFKVNSVYPNGTVIDFSGTAGQVREAFHTEIHNVVNRNGEKHIANMSDPKVPAAFKDAVAGVVSLNNFFPHKMISKPVVIIHHGDKSYKIPEDVFAAHKTEIMAMMDAGKNTGSGPHADDTFTCPASVCGEALTLYGEVPADFNTIYNVNPLWNASTPINGAGQKIVLIEDENMMAADFTSFRNAFLPTGYTGALTQVHPASSGTNNCTNPGGNSDESALDVEWAGAIAPNAAIELASCSDTDTTFGGLIAIQNLINTAGAPNVYSVSYGECEAETGSAGVAAFNSAYEQAAAQGQSVFVSSGDSDAAVCDGNGAPYSTLGISVNGWGSTPYNVSVGGTDFGDTYAGTNSTYWAQTTSVSTNYYESAKSYINEIPWNNSCASQLIYLAAGYSSGEAFCNSATGEDDYLSTGGGSGGPSAVFSKPSFQAGFAGIQNDGVRDMPDISLFAANGVWNQLVIFCYSASAPCNYNNGTDTVYNGAGGTSFASPQMAAIQALINEKTGEAQGDPNYIMYALAKTAYGTGGSSTCNSSKGNGIGSACVFQDVTQGDNDAPCITGTPNCYSSNAGDTYGVLSTSTTALDIAYGTTTGWDFATGIGTPNAANLANAWAAYSNNAPTVTVATSPTSLLAGAQVTWTANVTGNGSYPTGTVAFSVSGTSGTIATINLPVVPQNGSTPCTTTCSATASYVYTVPGGTAAGTYTVTANYAAPNEQYTAASGTGTYNVATSSTTSALSASPNPIAYGAGATMFTDVISLSAAAGAPTGSIKFSSSLPQVGTIATIAASSCTYNAGAKTDTCTYSWTPTYGGVQTITAAYTGDTTYTSSSATTSLNVTQKSTSTTLSINPATVTDVNIGTTFTSVTTYTGTSAPTGTVTISAPGLSIATVNVSTCATNTGAKTITCTVPEPNAWNIYLNGTYAMTAVYSGDAADAGSTSPVVNFTVAGEDTSTTKLTLATTASTYATGGTTVATIKLKGSSGDGAPTGTITITGTGTLGTLTTITLPGSCTLNNITYTCTPTLTIPAGTPAGAYTITATYSGDVNYLPSSDTGTYTVNQATPTAAISAASGGYKSTVTFSATNTGVANGVAPTGVVTFRLSTSSAGGTVIPGTPVCSASGLVDTCTLTYTLPAALTAGTYTITAQFATDTNYTISNTAMGMLTVSTDATSTSVTANPNSLAASGTTTLTATVTNTTVPGATPTGGTVTFTDTTNSAALGSCTLSAGTCSVSNVSGGLFASGANNVQASYGGVTKEFGASSGTTTVTITAAASGISFTSVSHNFGQVQVGTAAAAYGIQITNNSTTMAYPFSLVFTPANGFTSANSCGTSIAAGGHCELEFYFKPTVTGPVSASWSLAPESGFSYAPANGGLLQGSGTQQGGVSLTTNGHNFGTVTDGTTSATYGTELSNSTSAAVSLTVGPLSNAEFTVLTNCGASLAAGSSCELEFTFKPTTPGITQTVYPLSSPAGITSGGQPLPNGGITLTGTGQ